MSRKPANAPNELYVSCRPQRPPEPFCVPSGETCLLQACGLVGDETVPVLKCYADLAPEPARDLAGNEIVLSAESPAALVGLPGNYKLDVAALPTDRCVHITQECGEAGSPFDAALLACLDEIKDLLVQDNKPAIIQGLAHTETCAPAWIVYPCNDAGGYDFENGVVYTIDPATGATETIEMSATFNPGAAPAEKTDKEDLTPFTIDGPAAAQPVADVFAAALAASATTAFSVEGSDIALEDMAECGSFTIATKDGRPGIVLNGDTDNPVAAWSDTDGVNTANTIEVLEDCSALVIICVKKDYAPAKGA